MRLLAKKISETLRTTPAGPDITNGSAPEAASLLHELKNSMTLLYLAVENLKGSLERTSVCTEAIEDIKGLTRQINYHMDRFLETFPESVPPTRPSANGHAPGRRRSGAAAKKRDCENGAGFSFESSGMEGHRRHGYFPLPD